jgi:hypothetical protein
MPFASQLLEQGEKTIEENTDCQSPTEKHIDDESLRTVRTIPIDLGSQGSSEVS